MAEQNTAEQEPEIEVVIEEEKSAGQAGDEGGGGAKKEGEGTEGGKAEKSTRQKKKTHRGNADAGQVTRLMWEKQEASDRAEAAERELTAMRASNAQYEGIAAQSLEDSFATKRDLLTKQLRDAHTEGDAEKIAKTTSDLSKVEAQAAQMERYKLEKSSKPAPQRVESAQRQQPEADGLSFDDLYSTGNSEMRNWLDLNREWFHQDSENYNQEMVEDVTTKANRLEQEWQRNGRGSEIGTRAYFREMNRYIAENWSNEDEPVTQKPSTPQRGYGAPVNGRQAPGNSAPKRETVTITSADRNTAVNTPLRHDDGRPYTDEEKIKTFISNKRIMAANPTGEITMQMLKKGN